MAMSEIKVTPEELRNKADNLRDYNKNFRSEVEKMVGYVSQLSSMWEGEAKTAFEKAFNDDKPKMDAFALNIDKYETALRSSATEYEAAETKNASIGSTRSH